MLKYDIWYDRLTHWSIYQWCDDPLSLSACSPVVAGGQWVVCLLRGVQVRPVGLIRCTTSAIFPSTQYGWSLLCPVGFLSFFLVFLFGIYLVLINVFVQATITRTTDDTGFRFHSSYFGWTNTTLNLFNQVWTLSRAILPFSMLFLPGPYTVCMQHILMKT